MSAGVWQILRTCIIVTVLALLVWVVAESESLASERLEAPVTVRGDAEHGIVMAVASDAAWTGRIFVELEGGAASISRVRESIRAGLRLTPGMPGIPSEPGRHTLDFAEIVRALPGFSGSGISLAAVEPEQLDVDIERILTREIDVRVDLPEGIIASSVVAEPRRVRLSYPSAASTAVDRGFELIAEISAEQGASLRLDGRTTLRDIELLMPDVLTGVPFVEIEPSVVSVIATLDAREETLTLDAVPVRIQRPAFQAERWIVRVDEADQLLSGVVVSGPSDLIEQIRSNELRIFAKLSLTPDDLDAGITEKAVTFADLPSPLRFDVPDAVVRLTIEPVQPSE